jgi:hypothetical protein
LVSARLVVVVSDIGYPRVRDRFFSGAAE